MRPLQAGEPLQIAPAASPRRSPARARRTLRGRAPRRPSAACARPRSCSDTDPPGPPAHGVPAPVLTSWVGGDPDRFARSLWLSPSPPGERVAIGSVCASPSSTTRLVSAPARSTVDAVPSGPTIVAVCSSSGAACLTPGRCSTRASRRSSKPSGAARAQLQGRRADHRVDHFAGRAGDAAAGDDRREHERHGDRHAEARRAAPARRARAAGGGRGRPGRRAASAAAPARPQRVASAHPRAVAERTRRAVSVVRRSPG